MVISSDIQTRKFGKINVTPTPASNDNIDGAGKSSNLKKIRTVAVTTDPSSTYGLATKFFVLSALRDHDEDSSAHLAKISELEKRIAELERKLDFLTKSPQ